MADAPYLVALALLERDGRRALPLAGKSRSAAAAATADPGEEGRGLALELLLRVWQSSDEGALRRLAGESSLLLLEMPLEPLTEQVPALKARWLTDGDTQALLAGLAALCQRGWSIAIARHEPIGFKAWP
jgi:hypothetical protein